MTAGRPLAGWLWLLDRGEIFLIRRRHLRQFRLWRHR